MQNDGKGMYSQEHGQLQPRACGTRAQMPAELAPREAHPAKAFSLHLKVTVVGYERVEKHCTESGHRDFPLGEAGGQRMDHLNSEREGTLSADPPTGQPASATSPLPGL